MVSLDALVVSTSLTRMRSDLGASVGQLEWTVNAYNLALAVLLLPAAGLGDRFGRRRMFGVGVGVFTAASAWCAAAGSATSLIAARGVQGAGAALVTTLSFALVGAAYPAQRRGAAIGTLQGVVGLALIAGPLCGGVVAQHLSWHWIFWINVPIGVLVIPLSTRIHDSHGTCGRLDLVGLAGVGLGSMSVVWAVITSNAVGWGDARVVTAAALGLLLLAGFVRHELRTPEPLLPMRLFRSRSFSGGNLAMACLSTTIFTGLFFFAQMFQVVLGSTASRAGVQLLPWTGLLIVLGPVVGLLADRVGDRPLLAGGLLVVAIGYAWLALVARATTPYWQLAFPLVLAGIGGCCALPAASAIVLRPLPEHQVSQASGVNGVFRQLGGVFGLAATVAVFTAVGGYGSPDTFVHGFSAAIGTAAGVAAIGAMAGSIVSGKETVEADQHGAA
jgi:EmrB/QacA subfamily drug resistance transporter